MDLNTIELPASVVADLYGNVLNETDPVRGAMPAIKNAAAEQAGPPAGVEKNTDWRSLGNNARHILVLVQNRDFAFLPDHELSFFTGILAACKLSMEDVALVNLNNNPEVSGRQLTDFFKSRIVFLFDIEPASLGLPVNFPQYQLQPFAGTTYLYAPSLAKLEGDKLEKSKLWVCLKRLFNI